MMRKEGARYLLRFDDLCPTMNWYVWEKIERLLVDNGVAPLLAVVPENRDQALVFGDPLPDFWERVRSWQERGWSIGLHGYQHDYTSCSSGVLRLNKRSEFAGLSGSEQYEKIEKAVAVFESQCVRPDAWVAPAHSFDLQTVTALRKFGVKTISDGFSWRPFVESEMLWVPQQLWQFRDVPMGTWTVCMHHNHWGETELARFENDLKKYRERIVGLDYLLTSHWPEYGIADRVFSEIFLLLIKIRRYVKWADRARRCG